MESITKTWCPENAIKLVQNMSTFCVEQTDQLSHCEPEMDIIWCKIWTDCYPFEHTDSIIAGVWCMINSISGTTINLLTLLAIPYAKRHGRFGFQPNWDSTTLFIQNLALSDFLYCIINLPLYSTQYFVKYWPYEMWFCKAFAAFRYINAYADWLSLGFIALTRCVGLIHPKLAEKLFSGKSGVMVIVAIWLYALFLIMPTITGTYGTFGYNCRNGKCDFIATDRDKIDPHQLYYAIAFSLPCSIMVISYLIIWCYVRRAGKFLKRTGIVQVRDMIELREWRLTWTILLLCFCFLLFVMPISMINVFDPHCGHPDIHLFFFCIYWCQYSLNFVVYAYRSEQYRKAYADFLRRIWSKLKSCFGFRKPALFPTQIFFITPPDFPHYDSNQFSNLGQNENGSSSIVIMAQHSKNVQTNIFLDVPNLENSFGHSTSSLYKKDSKNCLQRVTFEDQNIRKRSFSY